MIANIVPGKGHATLLEALALLRRNGTDLPARIYGRVESAESLSRLTDQANALGIHDLVTFAGWSDNVWSAVSEIGIVVLPSESEGTPNCLLEAMAQAKLVVASSVGGIPEFIHHRENGWLHRPNDPAALASTLAEVIKTDATELRLVRSRAQSTWAEHYTSNGSVRLQFETYCKLCPSLVSAPDRE
ncbi:MAG: glycosyltransferase family 4 protein [bacterium]|nr:glycosyltransferase family 4 protein [bacterium]